MEKLDVEADVGNPDMVRAATPGMAASTTPTVLRSTPAFPKTWGAKTENPVSCLEKRKLDEEPDTRRGDRPCPGVCLAMREGTGSRTEASRSSSTTVKDTADTRPARHPDVLHEIRFAEQDKASYTFPFSGLPRGIPQSVPVDFLSRSRFVTVGESRSRGTCLITTGIARREPRILS